MNVPIRIAAIPSYIPSASTTAFADAAPGHRFMGYLRNTQGAGGELFTAYKGKAKVIGMPTAGAERRAANEALKNENDAKKKAAAEKAAAAAAGNAQDTDDSDTEVNAM